MNIEFSKGSNRLVILSLGSLLLYAFFSCVGLLNTPSSLMKQASIVKSFMQIPLHFESNQGQVDENVRFLSRGNGYNIYFTPKEVVMDLHNPSQQNSILRLQFMGANTQPTLVGKELLPSKSNYFVGNDSKQWHANIENFAKVQYQNLYPGTDAIFYGKQRQLEYDVKLAPGAKPEAVRFHIYGARNIHLDTRGNLILTMVDNKSVTMHKPVVYQYVKGAKRLVRGNFALFDNNEIGFKVGAYDKTKTLIIDPTLMYSTYLGGTGGSESGLGIASDNKGAVYVTGSTNSLDFPIQNPFQATNLGKQRTAFVTKLDAKGMLIYSTYLGGHGGMDQGFGIAVDPNGSAFVTGTTNSKDFPVLNPFQPTKLSTNLSGFVTKLNANGNALIYSTFLGGTGFYNEGLSIALDTSGSAYVAGFTSSLDFPVLMPFQGTNNGGNITGFVTKLNPPGNTLAYSTYLGGKGGNDRVFGIDVDCNNFAYVTGQTNSGDFPVLNPFQPTPKVKGLTAFVTKLNRTGNALVYSTYLGGSGGNDSGNDIAVDGWGSAYVTGFTNAKDFPVQNPFQATNNGPNFSAFITKLGPRGNTLTYSTYLGGKGGNDKSYSIAVDLWGSAYVTGQTNSTNFPLQNPIQSTNKGPNLTTFITKLNPVGNTLNFSTYFGGSGGNERGNGISIDRAPITSGVINAYVTGQTNSKDFPTLNPFQPINKGNVTGYVAKVGI